MYVSLLDEKAYIHYSFLCEHLHFHHTLSYCILSCAQLSHYSAALYCVYLCSSALFPMIISVYLVLDSHTPTLAESVNRVIHGSHFRLLFGYFSIYFLAPFCSFGRRMIKK